MLLSMTSEANNGHSSPQVNNTLVPTTRDAGIMTQQLHLQTPPPSFGHNHTFADGLSSPFIYTTDNVVSNHHSTAPSSSISSLTLIPQVSVSTNSEHSVKKRGSFDCSSGENDSSSAYLCQQQCVSTVPEAHSSVAKRSRPNNYIAPKTIPKTFNSEVGSLAAISTVGHTQQPQQQQNQYGNLRVHFRRQLSGSKIESFLGSGGDESMDIDADSRPRSMSF